MEEEEINPSRLSDKYLEKDKTTKLNMDNEMTQSEALEEKRSASTTSTENENSDDQNIATCGDKSGSDTDSWTLLDQEEQFQDQEKDQIELFANRDLDVFARAAVQALELTTSLAEETIGSTITQEKTYQHISTGHTTDSDIETIDEIHAETMPPTLSYSLNFPPTTEESEAEGRESLAAYSDGIPVVEDSLGPDGHNYIWARDEDITIHSDNEDRSDVGFEDSEPFSTIIRKLPTFTDSSDLSTSCNPEGELPPEFPKIVKGHTYAHTPNIKLNVALSAIVVLCIAMAMGLGIGHFMGWSERLELREQYADIREEKLEEMTENLVSCMNGEEGNGGDDQDLEDRIIQQLSVENDELKAELAQFKRQLQQQDSTTMTDINHEMTAILRDRINDLLVVNADLEKEVARLRYAHSAMVQAENSKKDLKATEIRLKEARQTLNEVSHENEQLKLAVAKARYGTPQKSKTEDLKNINELRTENDDLKNEVRKIRYADPARVIVKPTTTDSEAIDEGTKHNKEVVLHLPTMLDVPLVRHEDEALNQESIIENDAIENEMKIEDAYMPNNVVDLTMIEVHDIEEKATHRQPFINQWTVNVIGDAANADRIGEDMGCENKGVVMEDFFLFECHHAEKHSAEPNRKILANFLSHGLVFSAEQQRVLHRKRELGDPTHNHEEEGTIPELEDANQDETTTDDVKESNDHNEEEATIEDDYSDTSHDKEETPKKIRHYFKDFGSAMKTSSKKMWDSAKKGKFDGEELANIFGSIKNTSKNVLSGMWKVSAHYDWKNAAKDIGKSVDAKLEKVLKKIPEIPQKIGPASRNVVKATKKVIKKLETSVRNKMIDAREFLTEQLDEDPADWTKKKAKQIEEGLKHFLQNWDLENVFYDQEEDKDQEDIQRKDNKKERKDNEGYNKTPANAEKNRDQMDKIDGSKYRQKDYLDDAETYHYKKDRQKRKGDDTNLELDFSDEDDKEYEKLFKNGRWSEDEDHDPHRYDSGYGEDDDNLEDRCASLKNSSRVCKH